MKMNLKTRLKAALKSFKNPVTTPKPVTPKPAPEPSVVLDGTLANGRIFYDMNVKKTGLPDGMKVDLQGHIYCTGAGGVWVFDREGNHLGTIVTPEQPANCAWGDEDWQSLYITAQTSVYKIKVNIPGISLA